MLELIDELILLVTHLKYYDGPNCDLIKYKYLLVIIMGIDNEIKKKDKDKIKPTWWTLVYKKNWGSVSGHNVLFTVTHQERVRRERKAKR